MKDLTTKAVTSAVMLLWIISAPSCRIVYAQAGRAAPKAAGGKNGQAVSSPGIRIPEGISLAAGLSESALIAVALWNNAALQADLSALGVARADLLDAGLLRNPTLQVLLPFGYTQFEMLLNMPAEIFWQRPRRVAAARTEVERIARGLEQNGLSLVRDVRIAYYNLILAQDRAALAEEIAGSHRQTVRLMEVRLRVGDISDLECNAARIDRSVAEEQAARFAHDIRLAHNRLRTLLGLDDGAIGFEVLPPDPPSVAAVKAAVEDLLADACANRPDLRSAALAIEAAAGRAKWERSRVSTLAGLLSIKQGAGLDFSPRPGVLAELPVFNRNNGGIARADAEVERASRQYLALRHQIALEVREAHTQIRQSREALTRYQESILPQSDEGLRLAERNHQAGDESYLTVLEAARRYKSARTREAELLNELRRATAQLDRCIGRKYDARP